MNFKCVMRENVVCRRIFMTIRTDKRWNGQRSGSDGLFLIVWLSSKIYCSIRRIFEIPCNCLGVGHT